MNDNSLPNAELLAVIQEIAMSPVRYRDLPAAVSERFRAVASDESEAQFLAGMNP